MRFQMVHLTTVCYESRHLPGRLKVRAVQISGLVDSVALILLDKLVLQPDVAEPGCGEGAVD
jgi:hypothetical protein